MWPSRRASSAWAAINNFAGIERGGVGGQAFFRIGAGAKLTEIAASAELQRNYPALTAAAAEIAGPQIRNMGTLGGNLCQRNRCWYFRDEYVNCRLKSGNTCFALDGENQYHAIFTQGHQCVIASPSTLAPALIALGASADIVGPNGRRTLALANFYRAPANNNEREHVLASNELVASVTIPMRGLANGSYEVRQKLSSDWPLVQCAVSYSVNNGVAGEAKVVLSHVAPMPHVAEAAARALNGQAVTAATATAAGRAATEGTRPLSHNAYKVKLMEVCVKRAVMTAANLPRYWEA